MSKNTNNGFTSNVGDFTGVVHLTDEEMFNIVGSAIDEVMAETSSFQQSVYDFNIVDFIERIIYNDPYTIVFWTDGTKTSVKAHSGDTYSRMIGILACWMKKDLGNDSNWLDVLRKLRAIDENGDEPSGAINVKVLKNGKVVENDLRESEIASLKPSRRQVKVKTNKK